jgi:DNA processing protein
MSGVPPSACDECARRAWLLGALAGHLEPVRGRIDELLALDDDALIEAVAGADRDSIRRDHERFDPAAAAAERAAAGLNAVCRCENTYPWRLLALPAPPAVLHFSGAPDCLSRHAARHPVAIVGARRASAYGREMAHLIGRELGATGVTVVSGMAFGIDAAAHEGALAGHGATIAVLPGGADRPYPAGHRPLYRRIVTTGVAVSELGPGIVPRRWMFPARNRIIAGLSGLTVVVQARERSGALLTAMWSRRLGSPLGAVPGPAATPLSAGPHQLLRDGASLVTGGQDALDALYGVGHATIARPDRRGDLEPALAELLDALADGEQQSTAFARAGLGVDSGLAALAALEVAGFIRRTAGGRYAAI